MGCGMAKAATDKERIAQLESRVEELEQALWVVRGATIARGTDLEKVLFKRASSALGLTDEVPSRVHVVDVRDQTER